MPATSSPAEAPDAEAPDAAVLAAAGPAGTIGDVLHVLVVEDDPEINELVGAYARLAGFGYRAALNGDAALVEVRRHTPAVVVLDLMLPDLDGFEICRRIKGEPATRDVPVVILTALDSEKSRARAKDVGADAYLTKPFDPDRLMETMSKYAAGR